MRAGDDETSDGEGLIVLNSTDPVAPLPLSTVLHDPAPQAATAEVAAIQDHPDAGAAAAATQPEVILDDAAASKLFPKTVNSTYFNLHRLVRASLDAVVSDLANPDLLAEIASNNDVIAACSVRVSNFAAMLDELWAIYDQEHRAFCLWSSRGRAGPATAAGARVSGAAALGFLLPTESPARASINKPNEPRQSARVVLPVPAQQRPQQASRLDAVTDWRENNEGEVTVDSGTGAARRPVTFDTFYETLIGFGEHLLRENVLACRAPGVVGSRGVGHQIAMGLYGIARDLVGLMKRIGETRASQRRMWVAYVAPNTHRNEKAQRTGEKGFVRLPPSV